MSGKIVRLRKAKMYRNATSRSKERRENDAYRVREHLTEAEVDKLLPALKGNRHGHRDRLIGLVIYRHGLRVSEASPLPALAVATFRALSCPAMALRLVWPAPWMSR